MSIPAYKRLTIALGVICIGLLLSFGCLLFSYTGLKIRSSTLKPTLADFSFISEKTTLADVIGRIGQFSRSRGSGIVYYGYDIREGGTVWVTDCLKTDPPGQLIVDLEKDGYSRRLFPKEAEGNGGMSSAVN